jgi:mannitol-1-phosphate 5-dehydrogenase
MSLTGDRTFVGFGFGPIQGGLFLYEAYRSGAFKRLVVAEVVPEQVESVRKAGGWFRVNIAHRDRRETALIGPVELCNPAHPDDRHTLVEAIAEAAEIATAVPSVKFYCTGGEGSIQSLLAAGLAKKTARRYPRAVIYASENHNHAAEVLRGHVLDIAGAGAPRALRDRVKFLNTVIGKMSGVVTDATEISSLELGTVTPTENRAFLVESFNRILISQIKFEDGEGVFRRGLDVFEEKSDLLPFEEAKLFGHNATHALAAYVASVLGLRRMAEIPGVPGFMEFLDRAFVEESGTTLIRKHQGLDKLFTPAGYQEYAADLLCRMTNPFLTDTVERVGRDPERKLGWGDRLVGLMREALHVSVNAKRYAFGVAAALEILDRSLPPGAKPISSALHAIWEEEFPSEVEKATIVRLIDVERLRLSRWKKAGFPNLENLFQGSGEI